MKKIIVGTIALAILSALSFGIVCPEPVTCEVPFEHDPNAINFRVVKTFTLTISQVLVHDFNSCDPDEDNTAPLFHELLAGPAGVSCTPDGMVTFDPAGTGIFYADFRVTDSPIADVPASDPGTIVFRVLPDNRPPVLGGCVRN